jgi:DNA polymerase II large subunit
MGTTIGARMGRPEKAKARRMSPQLHGLFPLGDGVRRILGNAIEQGTIEVRLGDRYCTSCNLAQWEHFCRECGEKTKLRGQCTNQLCNKTLNPDEEGPCNDCGSRVDHTKFHKIDMLELKDKAGARLGQLEENSVKLKDQIDSPSGTVELLEKGILRARYDLHVFRDGTIRYDATDAPLTHFYPSETDISVEKLIEIGYTHDIYGHPLVSEDQLLEIKPQDILVNDSAIQHFIAVANFVDHELEQVYDLPPFYNIKTKEDIVGQLVIGLAPHTSAGVIGRVIGFTRSSVCWAHPFWHSSKRRNCDGDEDGLILLMDGFLNFSKEYLPTSRGSKMDTPLVLVATLNPAEVDDESFNLDSVTHYPLAFYYSASNFDLPGDVPEKINRAEDRIGTKLQYEGFMFSHMTKNIAEGPLLTRYKNDALDIRDKLAEQLNLAEIIRAVNERDTALRIFEKHALPDLMGNLRAFSTQQVRCVTCNTKYRRVPLRGNCVNENCRKSNLIFTVPPGGVTKYFDVCEDLVHRFKLGKYHEDRLAKIKISLDSLFAETGPTQTDLSDWM